MTYEELRAQMTAAMKAKDKVRLGVIRLVVSDLKNTAVKEQREITDADVTAAIKRVLKQTKETLELSEKATNNPERTEELRAQVAELTSLLPQQLSGEPLVALIEQTIAELGAATKKDMGKVMGALNTATDGNLDKAEAAREVGKRLS